MVDVSIDALARGDAGEDVLGVAEVPASGRWTTAAGGDLKSESEFVEASSHPQDCLDSFYLSIRAEIFTSKNPGSWRWAIMSEATLSIVLNCMVAGTALEWFPVD